MRLKGTSFFLARSRRLMILGSGSVIVNRRITTRLVGKKTIAALLMIVLFSVLIPTRGAEVARSSEQLRACQDNAGMVALAGHTFVFEISKAAIYLTRPEKQASLQSPTILIYPLRGPPALS